MRLLLFFKFSIVLFLALLSSKQAQGKAKPDSVDVFMRQALQKHHIPGAAVAVVKNGKVLKLQTYGLANLAWQAPVTPQTAFQMASATKPLTGTLLALLVQEDKLKLDDRIGVYLDSVPPAWQTITVRELAAHQSGIKLVSLEQTRSTSHALRSAAALPMEYEPGTKDFYVSTDYALLQAIISRVAQMPFEEALRQKVLMPLRMSNTHFDHTQDNGLVRTSRVIPQVASVYSWSKETGLHSVSDMRFPDWFYAAGGVYTSIRDVANWVVSLDKNTLLKPETMSLLWTPSRLRNNSPTHFGLGWISEEYQGHQIVGHSGGPALADIVRFVDGAEPLTVVVLTNERGGFPPYLAKAVAHYYVKGIKQEKPEGA